MCCDFSPDKILQKEDHNIITSPGVLERKACFRYRYKLHKQQKTNLLNCKSLIVDNKLNGAWL